VSRFSMAHQHN